MSSSLASIAKVVCAAFVAVSPISATAAETAIEREAIAIHQGLDALCRGGPGDADATLEACDTRLHAEKLLGLLGYCYGTKADFRERRSMEHPVIIRPAQPSDLDAIFVVFREVAYRVPTDLSTLAHVEAMRKQITSRRAKHLTILG